MKVHFDLRVLLAAIILSIVLGVLNNFRVYEEQRVSWFGGGSGETGE